MATKSAKTTKKPAAKSTAKTTSAKSSSAPRVVETTLPDNYNPVSMWGYFGWNIVFAIPLIGWIICICLAIAAKNVNLRNFARSQFCWLIIWIITVCILAGLGVINYIFSAFGLI